jgi:hypothetical protein
MIHDNVLAAAGFRVDGHDVLLDGWYFKDVAEIFKPMTLAALGVNIDVGLNRSKQALEFVWIAREGI